MPRAKKDSLPVEDRKIPVYERRFCFLFPNRKIGSPPRFQLHPPDAFEHRWTVFDKVAKRTVGYGTDPAWAVDLAEEYYRDLPHDEKSKYL
jgi:hypothetical protein